MASAFSIVARLSARPSSAAGWSAHGMACGCPAYGGHLSKPRQRENDKLQNSFMGGGLLFSVGPLNGPCQTESNSQSCLLSH